MPICRSFGNPGGNGVGTKIETQGTGPHVTTSIRFADPADAEAIAEIYRPFCEATAVSFETAAPSAGEMAERIDKAGTVFPWLVLDDGGVAGYAYASRHRERTAYGWSVDVTAYVAPGFRRRGVGRALYASLFATLRRLGFYKAYAGIALPNPASLALHEAAGFRAVGIYRGVGYKLGAWHDVAWYQLALQSERVAPPQPLSLSAVRASLSGDGTLHEGLRLYRGRPHVRTDVG